MPNRCVVYGCSNIPNASKGIGLHTIPFVNDERPEAKKRRRKWITFVNARRKMWTASKGSAICSQHFIPEDFNRRFAVLPGQTKSYLPRLRFDSVGIIPFPTVQPVEANDKTNKKNNTTVITDRRRRKLARDIMKDVSRQTPSSEDVYLGQTIDDTQSNNIKSEVREPLILTATSSVAMVKIVTENISSVKVKDGFAQVSTKCPDCIPMSYKIKQLSNQLRMTRNRNITINNLLKKKRLEVKKLQKELTKTKKAAANNTQRYNTEECVEVDIINEDTHMYEIRIEPDYNNIHLENH